MRKILRTDPGSKEASSGAKTAHFIWILKTLHGPGKGYGIKI